MAFVDAPTKLPRDGNAEAMQAGGSDGVEVIPVTDTTMVSVPVPEGALEARLWGVDTGGDTATSFRYGGSGTGFKPTGEAPAVPAAQQPFVASVATASILGVGSVLGDMDVNIQWIFGADDDAKP